MNYQPPPVDRSAYDNPGHPTREKLLVDGSQGLMFNFPQMFVYARLLGRQAVTGAHCGARTPQCKIINMQNNETITFYIELMLDLVSQETKLVSTQVVWYSLSQITSIHAVYKKLVDSSIQGRNSS